MTRCLFVDACHNTPNYNYCLLDALAQRDVRVTYATTEFVYTEVPEPPNVRVWYLFFGIARLARRLNDSRRFRRILRGLEYPFDMLVLILYVLWNRVDVVHWTWLVFPEIDWLAMKLLRLCGCRVVFTAHNALPHEVKSRDPRNYARVYREADQIIVLTQFVKDAVIQVEPTANDKIELIPHGDYDALFACFHRNEQLLERVRTHAAGRRIVAFLGSIRPYKGLEVFIESIPYIQRRHPDCMFLIAGNPLNKDREQIKRLVSQDCSRDDLWADIRYIPIEDLKAYVEAIDLLVQPYVEASQSGNTVMAFSAGVPVVSSDVGGLGEMIDAGRTGHIAPPRDPAALADAIASSLQAETYPHLAAHARKAAKDQFGWGRIAAQTESVYKRHSNGAREMASKNARRKRLRRA